MSDWYAAPSLKRLKAALDTRWPGRDHASDGFKGDPAHAARTSDHNPDPVTGVVRAIDIDKDGIHVPTVLASMIINQSMRYIIHNGRIHHVNALFKPKEYTGSNKHLGHIHGSIEHTKKAETSTAAWHLISTKPAWRKHLRIGMTGEDVRQLQAYLNGHGAVLKVDGRLGALTRAAVRSFQSRHQLKVDGVAGPQTLSALRTK